MPAPLFQAQGHGIYRIDTLHNGPDSTACYVLEANGRVAIIDTGARKTPAAIQQLLEARGLSAEAVDYVMPTHVHLDHAGACGQLMQRFPNARLVVHPRGARHMIDPTRLAAGTVAVYGEETFQAAFGALEPVTAERVVSIEDDGVIDLAGRELLCIHSPGHASHHYCVYDRTSGSLFAGDTFGVSFREFDHDGRSFVFPTTSPVDFDPDQWHQTLDKLMSHAPQRVFVAHFGRVDAVPEGERQLRLGIDAHARIARAAADAADRKSAIKSAITDLLLEMLRHHASPLSEAQSLERMATDLEINAQGLLVWLERQSS
ncbi:MAG: MBL fold metallo-hydrolase [Gammaproteobacteria bacterium]|nr:MBL fold metallo-hydrolase [Gammaproteobacteria bacterium]